MATQNPTPDLRSTHTPRLGFKVDFVAIAIAIAILVLVRLNILPSLGL